MHESGVAAGIMEVANRAATGKRITRLGLAIGPLSGVSEDSLRMYLDVLTEEQFGVASAIVVTPIPAKFLCQCAQEYTGNSIATQCPACGSTRRTIIDGMQCVVNEIEVEDETDS